MIICLLENKEQELETCIGSSRFELTYGVFQGSVLGPI